jgi:hypothetical protein
MNIEDYANMTPEEHAYYEGKAERNEEIERLRATVKRYDEAESAALADMEKYKEFYNTSVAEHRKSIELIDSLESQIEVLRPVYEAAKILRGACFFGKRKDVEAASLALRKAVDIAAGELEDSDE